MGIMVRKDNDRNSDLNDRISADLRVRAAKTERAADPDLVEDSDYTRDLKKTGQFGWVWLVLIALAILSLIVIITI